MRIFKTKWFTRFARKENIADKALREAVIRAEDGLIEADLGGGLIKQRIARIGEGKRGGYRTVIAYERNRRSLFLYGFAKNESENIDEADLQRLKDIAAEALSWSEAQVAALIEAGEWVEVTSHDG